jgi:hypothetical protein
MAATRERSVSAAPASVMPPTGITVSDCSPSRIACRNVRRAGAQKICHGLSHRDSISASDSVRDQPATMARPPVFQPPAVPVARTPMESGSAVVGAIKLDGVAVAICPFWNAAVRVGLAVAPIRMPRASSAAVSAVAITGWPVTAALVLNGMNSTLFALIRNWK